VKTAAGDVSRVANNFNTTVSRLNAPDGPIERLGDGTKALAQAVDSFNAATLPRVNRVADDTSRAVRRLGRAADSINDNPQSLLFGNGGAAAGPGEPGFSAPAARH
jgi:phospholipid/cholesterol/gamma-HCH transport system substrate-binding protein